MLTHPQSDRARCGPVAVVSSQENSASGASLPSLIPFSVLTKCEGDISGDDANMDKTKGLCKTIDVKIEEELEVTEVTTEDEVYDQYVIVDQSDEYKVIPIQQEVTNNTTTTSSSTAFVPPLLYLDCYANLYTEHV